MKNLFFAVLTVALLFVFCVKFQTDGFAQRNDVSASLEQKQITTLHVALPSVSEEIYPTNDYPNQNTSLRQPESRYTNYENKRAFRFAEYPLLN